MKQNPMTRYYAEYLLHGKRTMQEAADSLKIHKRTLQRHINDYLAKEDKDLYDYDTWNSIDCYGNQHVFSSE